MFIYLSTYLTVYKIAFRPSVRKFACPPIHQDWKGPVKEGMVESRKKRKVKRAIKIMSFL